MSSLRARTAGEIEKNKLSAVQREEQEREARGAIRGRMERARCTLSARAVSEWRRAHIRSVEFSSSLSPALRLRMQSQSHAAPSACVVQFSLTTRARKHGALAYIKPTCTRRRS